MKDSSRKEISGNDDKIDLFVFFLMNQCYYCETFLFCLCSEPVFSILFDPFFFFLFLNFSALLSRHSLKKSLAMKIALLLSGGVDSSVALRLLQEQGYSDITAYYLKIWLEDELSFLGDCPWEEDLAYARAVCEQAEVPLKVLSLQQDYYDRVVSYTVDELKKGRTPSPGHLLQPENQIRCVL